MMDDLISRQLVIKTLCERRCGNKSKGCPTGFCTESLAVDCIPSAQPEIIRCKDCKHWLDIDDGRQKHRMCADVYGNWFCADAKRREE